MLLKSAKSSFHYSKQPRRGACSVVRVWQFWGKRRHGSNAAVGTIRRSWGLQGPVATGGQGHTPGSPEVQKSASACQQNGPFVDSRERRTKAETQIMPSSCKGLIKEVASNESYADAACAKSVKTGMIDGEREFCCSRIRRARTIGDGFTDGR